MKFTFIFIFFFLHDLYPNQEEIAGNVNPNYIPRETGRVPSDQALFLPPSHFYADATMVFSTSVSYTLWRPYQEGLDILVSNTPPYPFENLSKGNILRPTTSFKNGFKVCLEKCAFYDDWTASISYMWFKNSNKKTMRDFVDGVFYTSAWLTDSHIDITNASLGFSNQFNKVQTELSKPLSFGSNFILTPLISFLGAWESQYLNTTLHVEKVAWNSDYVFMNNEQYWWCVGPGFGLELSFNFIRYLSLYLRGAGSMNFAKHVIYQKLNEADFDPPSSLRHKINTQEFRYNIEPMIESSLGFRIDYSFTNFAMFLKSSWDLQTWFSHNGFISAKNRKGVSGNYSMQGFTLSLGSYF